MARELDAGSIEPVHVVIPTTGHHPNFATGIGPGTAFVPAREPNHGLQVLYYEEPREGLKLNFADLVLRAHGRVCKDRTRDGEQRWPQGTRLLAAPTRDITVIGTYDPREGEITVWPDPALTAQLLTWLGLEHGEDSAALVAALQTSGSVEHEVRRELRRAIDSGAALTPTLRQLARRHGHHDLLGEKPEQQ